VRIKLFSNIQADGEGKAGCNIFQLPENASGEVVVHEKKI